MRITFVIRKEKIYNNNPLCLQPTFTIATIHLFRAAICRFALHSAQFPSNSSTKVYVTHFLPTQQNILTQPSPISSQLIPNTVSIPYTILMQLYQQQHDDLIPRQISHMKISHTTISSYDDFTTRQLHHTTMLSYDDNTIQ